MKALDTNILVRLLVNDDASQGAKAHALLLEAEQAQASFMVTTPVVLELIWVFSAVYEIGRKEIIDALENLLLLTVLEFEDYDRVRKLCTLAKSDTLDLADMLIGLSANDLDCKTTVTFDKRAAKSDLFELL